MIAIDRCACGVGRLKVYGSRTQGFCVYCTECTTKSLPAKTRGEAVRLWNGRWRDKALVPPAELEVK